MKICYHCKKELDIGDRAGRDEICPSCRRDVRCCLNCALHDADAPNQCREPLSEWVGDREKANFCEHFTFREMTSEGSAEDTADAAKRRLDELFKK
jgi:hypothetical protein